MPEPDPYIRWPLSDRLQMLAFEAELAHLPRPLIAALWEAIDLVQGHTPANFDHPANDLDLDRLKVAAAIRAQPGMS